MGGNRRGLDGDRSADDAARPPSSPGPGSGGRVPSDRDGVAGALRILAGLRSRTAVRDRPLPILHALTPPGADDVDARYAALQSLVDQAVDAVADPDHRAAARHLLTFDEGRWRPLKQRGADAAAVFGLGWDAYRRRRPSTGTSALEETLEEVAGAILGLVAPDGTVPEPETTPPDTEPQSVGPGDRRGDGLTGVATSPNPMTGNRRASVEVAIFEEREVRPEEERATPPTPRRVQQRRSLGTVPAVALVIVAVLGSMWWATSRPGRGEASDAATPVPVACANLVDRVGTVRAGSDPSLAAWAEPFREAASNLDDDRTRCAGPIETAHGQIFERISAGDGARVEALVATADGGPTPVVTLEATEFRTFRDSELDVSATEDHLGTPIRRADLDDGTRVVELTTGVIMSGPGDQPAFAVTQRFWQDWLGLGGVGGDAGRPIGRAYASPDIGRIQPFEHGQLVASYVDGEVRWEPLADADRQVPEGHAGAILRSQDGSTSWFVDLAGTRHWLPTALDYRCLADTQDTPVVDGVAPAAIEALPTGKALTCR